MHLSAAQIPFSLLRIATRWAELLRSCGVLLQKKIELHDDRDAVGRSAPGAIFLDTVVPAAALAAGPRRKRYPSNRVALLAELELLA